MVLYKRKPILLPNPKPLPSDLNIDVWHIDETGEWFLTYQEFLERLDFYTRHRFTCEITGASCLTFFQALDSEETQFKLVEQKFPIKLREPVARFLHFNSVRRLDALVESVYARFKNDFFPGETVYLRRNSKELNGGPSDQLATSQPEEPVYVANGDGTDILQPQLQKPYIIKEKAQFNATLDPQTGEVIAPAYAKYMLTEEKHGHKSFIADQSQVYRDRSTFTKHLIKCFCKITLCRASSKMGAPWCVKEEYLPIYGLTMNWPPDMLKYKDDESDISENKRPYDEDYYEEDDYGSRHAMTEENSEDEDVDSRPRSNQKRRKQESEDVSMHNDVINNVPSVIKTIMEDLALPYQGPPQLFEYFCQYDMHLDSVLVGRTTQSNFKNTTRLLQVFQFLITFGPYLCLSPFNLDQLVTSIKCTDQYELKGEVVNISLNGLKENKAGEYEKSESIKSDWNRNATIRNMIEQKNNDKVSYQIVKVDPADDEMLDNVNSNGTALLLEIFASLLRLFIDERGDWTCLVLEEWIEEGVIGYSTNEPEEFQALKIEGGHKNGEEKGEEDSAEADSTVDEVLEKCLNYRNVNWAERLAKRQFNNGYWLLILLGIFQDSMHIPTYAEFVSKFTEKVIPKDISPAHLPRQMWRNFCRNLSFDEKINCIWVLVDLLLNFSPDIKNAIEESMELCGQIRSERFKVSKDLKAEVNELLVLQMFEQHLNEAPSPEEKEQFPELLNQTQEKIEKLTDRVKNLKKDRALLDRKLMQHDLQRIRPIGIDRYGNKYIWLESNGAYVQEAEKDLEVPREDSNASVDQIKYHSGRMWIQGPNEDFVKMFLEISDAKLKNWKYLRDVHGIAYATKEVFKISRSEDGSIYQGLEDGQQVMLVDKEGIATTDFQLTPLQRKIIDETPERVMLVDDQWYWIEDYSLFKRLCDWFDTWGRREHDLLRQLKPIEDLIQQCLKSRSERIKPYAVQQREMKLLEQLQENEVEMVEADSGLYEQASDDGMGKEDEDELENVVDELMKLDDSSKTQEILDRIKQLETRRDALLEKIRSTMSDSDKPGGGVQARAEKKHYKTLCENILHKQRDILTDLINLWHYRSMEDVIAWRNELAEHTYGTQLHKNASGNKKRDTKGSVEEQLKAIIEETSRNNAAVAV